jgi:hypothetical protein
MPEITTLRIAGLCGRAEYAAAAIEALQSQDVRVVDVWVDAGEVTVSSDGPIDARRAAADLAPSGFQLCDVRVLASS